MKNSIETQVEAQVNELVAAIARGIIDDTLPMDGKVVEDGWFYVKVKIGNFVLAYSVNPEYGNELIVFHGITPIEPISNIFTKDDTQAVIDASFHKYEEVREATKQQKTAEFETRLAELKNK